MTVRRQATCSSLRKKQGAIRCSAVRQDATSVTATAGPAKSRYSQIAPPAILEYPGIRGYSITTKLHPTGRAIALIHRARLSSTSALGAFYERCKAIAAN